MQDSADSSSTRQPFRPWAMITSTTEWLVPPTITTRRFQPPSLQILFPQIYTMECIRSRLPRASQLWILHHHMGQAVVLSAIPLKEHSATRRCSLAICITRLGHVHQITPITISQRFYAIMFARRGGMEPVQL